MVPTLLGCLLTFGLFVPAHAQQDLAALERAAAARPSDVESRRRLADGYSAAGRLLDAAGELRKVTDLAPKDPRSWYGLGQAYNAIKREALATFDDPGEDAAWRQLLVADGLLANGQFADAFTLYRAILDRLPSMVTIHDSIARIYERTGHDDWAVKERAHGKLATADCSKRKTLCEFRAGRYGAVLTASLAGSDAESRYWRARAANELSLAAFNHLEKLPDSRERRLVRAIQARAEERHTDAAAELEAALKLAPGDPTLTFELASTYYAARDYDRASATLSPLFKAHPDDPRLLKLMGYSLLQSRRLDEAIPLLRRAMERDPGDPGTRVALGRAYAQDGAFADAVPLLEAALAGDQDGSVHAQLARAYTGLGQREKAAALLERSQELQRAAEERNAAAARRVITAPK